MIKALAILFLSSQPSGAIDCCHVSNFTNTDTIYVTLKGSDPQALKSGEAHKMTLTKDNFPLSVAYTKISCTESVKDSCLYLPDPGCYTIHGGKKSGDKGYFQLSEINYCSKQ